MRLSFSSPGLCWRTAIGIVCGISILMASPAGVAAGVVERSATTGWFDADGNVTAMGQAGAKKLGLPTLISGVRVKDLELSPIRERYSSEGLECASVQFRIMPDGSADYFMILEAIPKQAYGQEVAKALSSWKFAPSGQGATAIVTVDFANRGAGGVVGGSLLSRESRCAVPDVRISQMDVDQRTMLEGPLPYYPPDLVWDKQEGCVWIAFKIRPDGLADQYGIVGDRPDKQFLKAALDALNQWRFAPAEAESNASVQFVFDTARVKSTPTCQLSK